MSGLTHDHEAFTVLVVDDDTRMVETVRAVLELNGYPVLGAGSGTAALRVVAEAKQPVGLAVVDLQLPDIPGLALSTSLRELCPDMEIVVLTGNASLESAVDALRKATVDYLIKPVDPETLIQTIASAEGRWRYRRIEEELRRTNELFRLLVEHIGEVVTLLDVDGVVRYESPAARLVLGAGGRVGRTWCEVVHPEDRDRARRFLQRAATTSDRLEPETFRARHRNGEWRLLECSAGYLLTPQGGDGAFLVCRDVTERQRLEARVREAEKLEAVGQLTAGIAHEINNIFNVIVANAGLVELVGDADDELRLGIRDALRAARSGADLIRKLLGFSRRERLHVVPIDLGGAVREAAGMIGRLLPQHVELAVAVQSPARLVVDADRSAVEQILLNLAANARDAITGPGRVTVEVERVASEAPGTTSWVRFVVRDNGCGMDEVGASRVFEPFYSTKSREQGTGLGMSVVYGLVQQQGGRVDVSSVQGEGTEVSVSFPASEGEPAATEGRELAGQAAGGGTILLVEDQLALQRAARRILELHGYRVLTAADGQEGLDQFLAHEHDIDLIVADVVMPKVGGKRMYDMLRERGKAPRILFCSGYSAADLRDEAQLDRDLPLLRKPWTLDELVNRVAAMIEGPPIS